MVGVPTRLEDLHRLLGRFPRVPLAFLPTPLHELPGLTRALGGPRIFIKRDDLTGLATGGNKARKLEFIMADARARNADSVIFSAAAQSNMARMTAAAAAILGMSAHLVLRSVSEEALQGNLLLDRLFGASVTLIPTLQSQSQISFDTINQIAQSLRDGGHVPYVIDLRHASAPLAALGYVLASVEIEQQCRDMEIHPNHLFLATGSAGTFAGLLLGSALLRSDYRVVGISVSHATPAVEAVALEKVRGAAALLGVDNPVDQSAIVVDDRWIGPAYGVPTDASIDAMKLIARTDGIVLDPVYTGKGLSGLIGWIREGRIGRGDNVIFLHSGGTPGLFALADKLSPQL